MGQRVYATRKFHGRREMTALWAVEQAVEQAREHGVALGRSAAVRAAVEALLAVIEEELS